MKKLMILNSAERIEGDTLNVQIAPFGDFPGVLHSPGGKSRRIVQKLDGAAFERIINAWNAKGRPELLVDADHNSTDGGSTVAYAWISQLHVDNERGLMAEFRFTERGLAAVNGREYRFVSPVFECGNKGEVLELSSVALTNRPNLPVSCVLNSSETGDVNVEDRKETHMEKILAALGLAEGASEDDAVAAITALKGRAEGAEAKVLENEAEACAEENREKIENREEFVKLYVKNGKDAALAFLSVMKTPAKAEAPKQTILNAKGDDTPKVKNAAMEGLAKCANAAERIAYVTAHAAEFAG